jgi:hypothetical protein
LKPSDQNAGDILAAILATGERLLKAQAAEESAISVYRRDPRYKNMQRVLECRRAVEQITEEYLASTERCPSRLNSEPATVQSAAPRGRKLRPLLDTPI